MLGNFYINGQADNFFSVRQKEESKGRVVKTIESLVYLANRIYESPGEENHKKVLKRMRLNYIFSDTGIMVGSEGIYLQNHPLIRDNKVIIDKLGIATGGGSPVRLFGKEDLREALKKGRLFGRQTPEELAENLYLHFLIGRDGAEQLAKASEKCEYGACVDTIGLQYGNPRILYISSGGRTDWQRAIHMITIGDLDPRTIEPKAKEKEPETTEMLRGFAVSSLKL